MNSPELKSGNYLFLICPTDHIEGLLSNAYKDKAYFYTALGTGFSWDFRTQQKLIELIENQNINHIIFVSKCTNRFYQETDTFEYMPKFQINDTLLAIEKTLPYYFLNQSHHILKIMLLASRHLQKQHKRIVNTSVLGSFLKQNNVSIKSFVYQPKTALFFSPQMIEKKVLLYSKLSPN